MSTNTEKGIGRPISRREFGKLVKGFGFAAAFGALSSAYAANRIPTKELMIAQAKKQQEEDLAKGKKAKYSFRIGASSYTPMTEKMGWISGVFHFKKDLEDRTDGAIHVDVHGASAICNEASCIQKILSGVIPAGMNTTQNASSTVPFLNCLDFPYLWPSVASGYYFLYSRETEEIFRKPLREKFDLEILTVCFELRRIYLGPKYRGRERIRLPEQCKGFKIRTTNSALIITAVNAMGMNAAPLAWSEALEGLKSGVVDGTETSEGPAAAYGMIEYCTQDIKNRFESIFGPLYFRSSIFRKLPSQIQEEILESAYNTQIWIQSQREYTAQDIIGETDPPKPGTIYDKGKIVVNELTPDELKAWEKLGSPKYNPQPYDKWRQRLHKMVNMDMFEAIYEITHKIPVDTRVLEVAPQRWWKT